MKTILVSSFAFAFSLLAVQAQTAFDVLAYENLSAEYTASDIC